MDRSTHIVMSSNSNQSERIYDLGRDSEITFSGYWYMLHLWVLIYVVIMDNLNFSKVLSLGE